MYLQDIFESAERVLAYTQGMDQAAFEADQMVVDAVLRNLEIIGEAAKRLPSTIKEGAPQIPWKMICGFRDRIAHGYFGLDNDRVWDVVAHEVPVLLDPIRRLLTAVPAPG